MNTETGHWQCDPNTENSCIPHVRAPPTPKIAAPPSPEMRSESARPSGDTKKNEKKNKIHEKKKKERSPLPAQRPYS
jgi:hypothetical protein